LTSDDLRDLHQRATRRGAAGSACPSGEVLVDVAAGSLSADHRDKLADHLVTCADCAEEYRVLRAIETERRRQASGGVAVGSSGNRAWWGLGSPQWLALAALFVATVGLGAWVWLLRHDNQRLRLLVAAVQTSPPAGQTAGDQGRERALSARVAEYEGELARLRKSVDTLSAPQLNTPIIDLEPPDALRSAPSGQTVQIVELSAGAAAFTAILHVPGAATHQDYGVTITNVRGQEAWRGRGLRRTPFDTFTLTIGRDLIPPGTYRVRIAGIDQQRERPLQEYTLRIIHR
jgi:hypothetical protein